ncbi:hypothetical protein UFOVP401_7 [uncultured Caudovirales phage]|uniref:Uncharacterized protein n=1 Tax=uncultured Caudovirales phage TaxID=2100421 RepID=A0A6J5M5Y4_9CAUD|nr:hypothetical protein UFOVP401_7 [uncultured Caudovirales phage]
MISRSMKRIVLSIVESSREVVDAWRKNSNNKTVKNKADVLRALDRLERAVKRLDRMQDA